MVGKFHKLPLLELNLELIRNGPKLGSCVRKASSRKATAKIKVDFSGSYLIASFSFDVFPPAVGEVR